ncbi:MAG: LLM class flavin-dependent oxidoreductase [SAR202 cluster bacterium]|nr:LLM class flavin-dependent oxidoreductase [Verrucomicrobiales bacterium]MQG33850.1 LLM class flavin-dependent oxidoreductase [SAR202 cluster bacterium]HCP23365.1 LLM class flavin-dependent oxidoreductase [Dehalococcoidia bacterium]
MEKWGIERPNNGPWTPFRGTDLDQQLILSVVDQTPVPSGATAGQALRNTIALAVEVEKMGYQRYWLAEHHSAPNYAGTSPEILIGQVAAQTKSIRVGSGGVMLSHYSALKVAENFRLLGSLYPGRIDLGIGRAPGSDQVTAAALSFPGQPKEIRHFPRQVVDLLGFLKNDLEENHFFSGIQAGPGEPEVPDVWLLGSRYESAHMAAQLGLPFAFAHFFGISVEDGPAVVENYKKNYQPSEQFPEPKVNVGVHVVCAETEEEALRQSKSRNLGRLFNLTGRAKGIPTPEESAAYVYQAGEEAFVNQYQSVCVDGTPEQVKEGLDEIAELYQTPDLSIVTITHGLPERIRSYELVAKVCGLTPLE